jgi:predicted metal-dependent peptidase
METKHNPETQYKATHYVREAIERMIEKDPFFGHITDQMRLCPDARKDVTTIATNGRLLVYDSQWVVRERQKIGPEKFATILAHKAAHVAFGHPYRQGDKKPEVFDKACDAVINGILRKKGYDMPEDSFFYQGAENMSVEECYRKLMEQQQPSPEGQDGKGQRKTTAQASGKTFSPDEGTDAEEKAKAEAEARGEQPGDGDEDSEDKVREGVARAAQKARKAGNMPGDWEAMIDASWLSKKSWKEELRQFLGGGEQKEPSWSKPNRRYVHQGEYLPGPSKFGPGRIVLAVDVSGSVQGPLVEKFCSEVRKINIDLQPEAIDVMTCDTRVVWQEEFGPYDDVQIPAKAITGGGTKFNPVFERVKQMGVQPKALVYFTDLECYDFGTKPDFPVLWVVWPGGSSSAPWGTIVHMDD